MNKFDGASTRTGYYLRKFLDMNVNADPNNTTNGFHIKPWIRYTEIFLGYAEAANEAWGPQGKGIHGYSAYDVIKAIRQRAGIGENGGDPYLESVKMTRTRCVSLSVTNVVWNFASRASVSGICAVGKWISAS